MPIVYKITNTINQKCYIGWTGVILDNRWGSHKHLASKNKDNRKFYNAIRKYGTECWNSEVLLETSTKQEAKNLEIQY